MSRTLVDALRDLDAYARAVFAEKPELRSVMVAVAQYWNDEADDAVHAFSVGSTRSTPRWPHSCVNHWDEEDPDPDPIDGELCCNCGLARSFPCDDNGSSIPVFEPYCHDQGNQEETDRNNYTPLAIARRAGEQIEIEFVGVLHRPDRELLEPAQCQAAMQRARRFDARATELFEQVCANTADDGPRRVLADYLIEREDPRGEYISLCLADLDDEGRARRDALLEAHRWSWVHPLGAVIPRAHATFARGLLTAADVEIPPDELAPIEDALAWGSVERLHFLPGSTDFVSPAMRALREVGPLRSYGIVKLKTTPWVERIHVSIAGTQDIARLNALDLPRLTHVAIDLEDDGLSLAMLREARWWSQLERVTWVHDIDEQWTSQLAAIAPVRWLESASLQADGKLAGWLIAVSREAIEVSLMRWRHTTTRSRLIADLLLLPDLPITLKASAHWEPTADDVAALAAAGRRAVVA